MKPLKKFGCRRRKYFYRCQEIVDYIHFNVSTQGFVDEEECIHKFGLANYKAFKHELHQMNADVSYQTMTPAMEWMFASRYFNHLANDELRNNVAIAISVVATLLSIIATSISLVALLSK